MKTKKTIIVPVDFSSCSINALKYAGRLAKEIKAGLLLVHVQQKAEPGVATVMLAFDSMLNHQECERKLKRLCTSISKLHRIECRYECAAGNVVNGILRTAEKHRATMIVMGAHGTGSLKKKLMGNNTCRVMEKAVCPVTAVPPRAAYEGIAKIAFATDLLDGDVDNLRQVVGFAKKFSAHISIVHACNRYDAPAEKMLLENFSAKVRRKISYRSLSAKLLIGETADAVGRYVRETSPQLVVIPVDRRGWLVKLFGPAVSRKMVLHTRVPVMAI